MRRAVLASLFLERRYFAKVFLSSTQEAPLPRYAHPFPAHHLLFFRADNVSNTPIDDLPVNRNSAGGRLSIPGKHLTLGFGPAGGKNYGFPFAIC